MIRRTDTYKDNQARYIRNDNRRQTDYFNPDSLHQYDHLIPPAKKALKFTAKATWFMVKNLVKIAFRLPRLFSKANTPKKVDKRKNPSPPTAFPAP